MVDKIEVGNVYEDDKDTYLVLSRHDDIGDETEYESLFISDNMDYCGEIMCFSERIYMDDNPVLAKESYQNKLITILYGLDDDRI